MEAAARAGSRRAYNGRAFFREEAKKQAEKQC
jgi:hypothetical protein